MSHLRMRARLALAALALCALVSPLAAGAQTAPAPSGTPSLYHRLGGYDAIAAVTDDFIGRLASDPKLQRFFVGASDNSKARIRQLVVDQLCAATGGPCVYLGRDMKTVHKGLNITEADWAAAQADFGASLDKFKVGAAERRDLAAALAQIKPDIVTAK
ncbi:MAG TPA: group 1 truncated hemoglobin [Dongiaceae bacterium]|nr:group 1 truncated hemoglobin [Dongiaceae bacterium]